MAAYKEVSLEDGERSGFGTYPVTLVPDYRLKLSDGVHLSVKLWLPFTGVKGTSLEGQQTYRLYSPEQPSKEVPQPVILEYLPYRKTDWSLARDWRHLWFSSHGYICARVDMRGSGDSEGLYYGEYFAQEQKDGCEFIAWIAEQPWCNGNVGMYGKSWGGFNGLQLAYEQPPALKTIITLYSTDDRYATDIHFRGGCLLLTDHVSWATVMHVWNTRPPSPHLMSNWRDVWRKRLEATGQCWLDEWLSHQSRDHFWKHASICEQYSNVQIPVLAIGGWRDGYRDAVLRMAQHLPADKFRGILGPWSHDWPDVATPGPRIDYLDVCLEWWDRHLKNINNNAMEKPLLRMYLQEGEEPGPPRPMRAGHWLAENTWPPTEANRTMTFIPNNQNGLLCSQTDAIKMNETWKEVPFSVEVGLFSGEWLSFGANDTAGDQRGEDARSLCWTTAELQEEICIMGNIKLECALSAANSDRGVLVARLCDVFPDGRSMLISHGMCNLTHRNGHGPEEVTAITPGATLNVVLSMTAISYIVPKGHQLRLAVSPSYVPVTVPPPVPVSLSIKTGASNDKTGCSTKLILPVVTTKPVESSTPITFGNPRPSPPNHIEIQRPFGYHRYVNWDLSSGLRQLVIEEDNGRSYIKELETTLDEKAVKTFSIQSGDPLSFKMAANRDYVMEWPTAEDDGIKVHVHTECEMWADATHFFTKTHLHTTTNGEDFYSNTWHGKIERNLV